MKSILLIEDRVLDASRIVDSLRNKISEELRVTSCESYEEAFGLIFLENWDLILIHYHLTGRDGLATMKRIRSLIGRRETPIILYHSVQDTVELSEVALKEGATDCLPREELLENRFSTILNHLSKPNEMTV